MVFRLMVFRVEQARPVLARPEPVRRYADPVHWCWDRRVKPLPGWPVQAAQQLVLGEIRLQTLGVVSRQALAPELVLALVPWALQQLPGQVARS